jgi:YbbR domain-containing protein
MQRFRFILKTLPALLLAFTMAIAVWILAVTSSDPLVVRDYPKPITLEVVGLDPKLLITNTIPVEVTVKLSAPQSIWTELENQDQPVHAILDLSALKTGSHSVPVQIQVTVKPVRVLPFSPSNISVNLELFDSRSLVIQLQTIGQPATGFQVAQPILNPANVTISGAASTVEKVERVSATLDISQVRENINMALNLNAFDVDGKIVDNISIAPSQTSLSADVTPLSGYRNVAVKVIWNGQPARGYQLANISVDPPAVTVFSIDPLLVENLPGYIETMPLDLSNADENFTSLLNLNTPLGITVIEGSSVDVSVGIMPIEGTLTIPNIAVEYLNLPTGYQAVISPSQVTIILSGPLPSLDALSQQDIKVIIDLQNILLGTFQKIPKVQLTNTALQVVSIIPESVSVTIATSRTPEP